MPYIKIEEEEKSPESPDSALTDSINNWNKWVKHGERCIDYVSALEVVSYLAKQGRQIDILDLVRLKHTLICSESDDRNVDWYEFDHTTKLYSPVSSINNLIVRILEDLGHRKKFSLMSSDLIARLKARCSVDGLTSPCYIEFDHMNIGSHKAKSFIDSSPFACKTKWYLCKSDGSSVCQEYSEKIFILNRLDFDPAEGEPEYTTKWLEDRVGPEQAIAVWQWIAYCITPYNTNKIFHIWRGEGNTGKSTGVALIRSILGNHNVASTRLADLNSDRNRFATYDMRGKLLNISEEDAPYGRAAEETIKAITGGTPVPWEKKYGGSGNEVPTFKLLFTSNADIKLFDNSGAYANRMLIITWGAPFGGVLPQEGDENFKTIGEIHNEFHKEMPQILYKCLKIRETLRPGKFKIPDYSKAIKQEFIDSSTPLRAWFKECVKFSPGSKISVDKFFENYRQWCSAAGFKPNNIAHKVTFAKQIRALPAFKNDDFREFRNNKTRGFEGVMIPEIKAVSI